MLVATTKARSLCRYRHLERAARVFVNKMVGMTRFEHATPWSQTRCSTKLSYVPKCNDNGVP